MFEPEVESPAPLVARECITLDAAAGSPMEVLNAAAQLLHRRHRVRPQLAASRLARREVHRSTAEGGGVALPHADMPGIARAVAAFVRLREPIPFGAPDGEPVRDFLVLLAPRPAGNREFELLQYYRSLLARHSFRDELAGCEDAGAVWRLLHRHEWRRPGRDRSAIIPSRSSARAL